MSAGRREAIEKAAMVAYLTGDNSSLLGLGPEEEIRPVVEALLDEISADAITYTEACQELACSMVDLVRARRTVEGFPERTSETGRPYLMRSDLPTIARMLRPPGQASLFPALHAKRQEAP
jgi:hypothetical protein